MNNQWKFTLAFLSALFMFRTHTFAEDDLANLIEKLRPSVVMIYNFHDENSRRPDSFGSGWVYQPDQIITNVHVVRGAAKIIVRLPDGSYLTSPKLVGMDEKNDLAILSVPGTTGTPGSHALTPLKTNTAPARVGQKIIVIGSPKGFEFTVSDGIISSVRDFAPGMSISPVIQITAAISPGSSGGPVFNEQGQVVGIVSFTYLSGQNLNFAIPAASISKINTDNPAAWNTLTWPAEKQEIKVQIDKDANPQSTKAPLNYDTLYAQFRTETEHQKTSRPSLWLSDDYQIGYLPGSYRLLHVIDDSHALLQNSHEKIFHVSKVNFSNSTDNQDFTFKDDTLFINSGNFRFFDTSRNMPYSVLSIEALDTKLFTQAAQTYFKKKSDDAAADAKRAAEKKAQQLQAIAPQLDAAKQKLETVQNEFKEFCKNTSKIQQYSDLTEQIKTYLPSRDKSNIAEKIADLQKQRDDLGVKFTDAEITNHRDAMNKWRTKIREQTAVIKKIEASVQ